MIMLGDMPTVPLIRPRIETSAGRANSPERTTPAAFTSCVQPFCCVLCACVWCGVLQLMHSAGTVPDVLVARLESLDGLAELPLPGDNQSSVLTACRSIQEVRAGRLLETLLCQSVKRSAALVIRLHPLCFGCAPMALGLRPPTKSEGECPTRRNDGHSSL